MKVVAEGAEAVVYETELAGVPALLKRRMKKRYRVAEMDTKIRAQRSKNEARIMAMASKAGINAPKLLLFDGYDIYMTSITGKRLSEAEVSPRIFEKIGIMLGQLHNTGIAHGDYTPANIIVGNGMPHLIDFGLSQITESVEEKALDILLMKRSISKASHLAFLKGYRSTAKGEGEMLKRLETIERRGRYQTRTLA